MGVIYGHFFPKLIKFAFLSFLLQRITIIEVDAQFLQVDYNFVGSLRVRLINGVQSTPIRFIYRDFDNVDRLFCKYVNTTRPFAAFDTNLGTTNNRVLTPTSSDYMVVNSTIGRSGYYGLKIIGRIDRDDQKFIVCQFSTRFTIDSSAQILLSVISPVTIRPYLKPATPVIGESVQAGCIVEGFPYPTVEVETPFNMQYTATQINPPNTKLIAYKYVINIKSIDESWNGQRIYCSALQNGGTPVENYVTIRIGGTEASTMTNPAIIAAVVITTLAVLALIIMIATLSVRRYRRSKSRGRNVLRRYERQGYDSSYITEKSDVKENPAPSLEAVADVEDRRVFRPQVENGNAYEVSTAAFV